MRSHTVALIVCLFAANVYAQTRPPNRPRVEAQQRGTPQTVAAEGAVKEASEDLAEFRRVAARDIAILMHLRAADAAMADAMQPSNAIQKAFEEVDTAKSLGPDFYVMQGVIKVKAELEEARRSPVTADFGRLRTLLREHALGPASRVAVRNALHLEEETAAWLRVQDMISAHLRTLTDIAGDSLRATETER
ncbi:MAG TPA: hypothetical protein VMU84_01880 [Thermoanaerobaculia bacterium]|nr:hypothetical protein [Thermoanaerobaculia bacterium]